MDQTTFESESTISNQNDELNQHVTINHSPPTLLTPIQTISHDLTRNIDIQTNTDSQQHSTLISPPITTPLSNNNTTISTSLVSNETIDNSLYGWAYWGFNKTYNVAESIGNFFVELFGIGGDYDYVIAAAERIEHDQAERELYPPNN